MSEVTEKKPQKKLRLFGQHPDRQSRLVPERKVSEHQGAVFRIVYKDKGRHERSEWYGRIVDFQPALDRDKVVGVYISYRPGRFGGIKGAWEEDRKIETRTLGPFDSISRTVASVKIPVKQGDKDSDVREFEVHTWALMGATSDRPCRELTFTLMPPT